MLARGLTVLLSFSLLASAPLGARADDNQDVKTDVKQLNRDVDHEVRKDARAVKREAEKDARAIKKDARKARQSVQRTAHRIQEAACTGTNAECDATRSQHRHEEARGRASDKEEANQL